LVFKIKIKFFKFYFLALLLLATNTTGFDIYFHAISVADFDLIDYYNPVWVVSGYELPRYLYLHYFFWLITCFGILPLIPVLAIFYAFSLMRVAGHKFTHGLIKHAVIAVMVMNIVFTSALGISLMAIGLGVISKANNKTSISYLLVCLGSVLHPIGFVVGLFFLSVLRGWLYLLILPVLIHILHLLTTFFSANLVEYQRVFELSDLMVVNSFIYEKVVDKLIVETFALFALFALYLSSIAFGKIREIRLVLNKLDLLYSKVSVDYVIWAFLAVALAMGYPSHLTTGGPLAVLSFHYDELPRETLNIISATWVSPYLLHDSIKSNQYYFRGD